LFAVTPLDWAMLPIIDNVLPFTAVKPVSCDDDAQFCCFVAYGRKSKPALTIPRSSGLN
jgi:hypothetical protein